MVFAGAAMAKAAVAARMALIRIPRRTGLGGLAGRKLRKAITGCMQSSPLIWGFTCKRQAELNSNSYVPSKYLVIGKTGVPRYGYHYLQNLILNLTKYLTH